MKLVTTQEMQDIEKQAIETYQIPSLILMENAGLHIFEIIRDILGTLKDQKILLLIGRGNNGGDGLVIARHLMNAGAKVKVLLLYPPDQFSEDAVVNYQILTQMQAEILNGSISQTNELPASEFFSDLDLIVDAIFGTGFRGELDERIQHVAGLVNASSTPVIAVDIPSGLEADHGRAANGAIRANYTVTLGLIKVGLVQASAAEYVGQLHLADISLPQHLIAKQKVKQYLIDPELIRPFMLRRAVDSHKGSYGHVLVLGGSHGMMGAVIMASLAALRSGAGLVTSGIPVSMLPVLQSRLPEVMVKGFAETEEGMIDVKALIEIREWMQRVSVTLIGPGMGQSPDIQTILADILTSGDGPLVIDADGLNALAKRVDLLKSCSRELVLTPHPGEMARLLGTSIEVVQRNRLRLARQYAMEWELTLVLKGSSTIVATPEGDLYINPTGNAGMATGGSGDILAGIIAGLIAQGLSLSQASIYGVYSHGLSGDLAAEIKGQRGMIASDILHMLPTAFIKI